MMVFHLQLDFAQSQGTKCLFLISDIEIIMFISLNAKSHIFFFFNITFYQRSCEGSSLDLFLPLFIFLLIIAQKSSHSLFAQIHQFSFKTEIFLG